MTSTQQQLAGRLGGLVKASRYNAQDLTVQARQGFLARFEREVDPAGKLDPLERQRRAAALKRAYFVRLAAKSAETRRKRASKTQ
jgi:hypothetical protein